MNFFSILEELEVIRKFSQLTPDSNKRKLDSEAKKKLEEREASNNAQAKTKLEALLKEFKAQYGVEAEPHFLSVLVVYQLANLVENLIQEAFLEPAQGVETLYDRIYPLCVLAYFFEKNGDPKEHATKLATIFKDQQAVITYWLKYAPSTQHNYLVHDACLFDLPDANECTFEYWKALANQSDNMLNPDFRTLLPHANAIERLIKADINMANIVVDVNVISKLEKRLSSVARNFKAKKSKPVNRLNSEQKAQRIAELKELSQQRHNASLELAEKCFGMPLKKMTVLRLLAVYEKYKTENSSGHGLLIDNGISAKEIRVFYSLIRSNDDIAIPNLIIDGGVIGYPGIYLKKLDTISDHGAAIAASLGRMTHCCQHLGGAGSDCTKHGISSPNGGFYVLCKGNANESRITDEILAQSWVWRSNANVLCLDSIEKKNDCKRQLVSDMYRYLGQVLCTRHNIPCVNTGSQSGITADVALSNYPSSCEHPIDYFGYRDSTQQYMLAHSSMPYALVSKIEEIGSKELKAIITTQSRDFFTAIFTKPAALKDNEFLKQAIAFALYGNECVELIDLMRLCTDERRQELDRLININRRYLENLNKNTINFSAVEEGAFINAVNNTGQSALHIAMLTNNNEAVEQLITSQVNLNIQDRQGWTSLHLAAINFDSLKTMLTFIPKEQLLDLLKIRTVSCETVLHLASKNVDLLTMILNFIPEEQRLEAVKVVDINGGTLLHVSARDPESLRAILNFIPESQRLKLVKAANEDGDTVLHLSAGTNDSLVAILNVIPEAQRLEVVKAVNKRGQTVLHLLANHPDSLLTIVNLIPEGQQLEAFKVADMRGQTVLHVAAIINPHSVREILNLYSEEERLKIVKVADECGRTALHFAANTPDSLREILNLYSEEERLKIVKVADECGRTALHFAANTPDSLREIINLYSKEQRLSVLKLADATGKTLLHLAAKTPDSLSIILNFYPEDERLEALKAADRNDQTVISMVSSYPNSFRVILNLIPEDQRLDAVKTTNMRGHTILNLAISDLDSLEKILTFYPEEERLEAVKQVDISGYTMLHRLVKSPDSVRVILSLIPENQRLDALDATDPSKNTVLNALSKDFDSMMTILAMIPEEKRLEAIKSARGADGYYNGRTLIHSAIEQPNNAVVVIFNLIAKDQRLEAVNMLDGFGGTVLPYLKKKPDLMAEVLNLLPENQRLIAINEASYGRDTLLHQVVAMPGLLAKILYFIPEDQRQSMLTVSDEQGRSVIDIANNYPDSMDVIKKFISKPISGGTLSSSRNGMFSPESSSSSPATGPQSDEVGVKVGKSPSK